MCLFLFSSHERFRCTTCLLCVFWMHMNTKTDNKQAEEFLEKCPVGTCLVLPCKMQIYSTANWHNIRYLSTLGHVYQIEIINDIEKVFLYFPQLFVQRDIITWSLSGVTCTWRRHTCSRPKHRGHAQHGAPDLPVLKHNKSFNYWKTLLVLVGEFVCFIGMED